MTREKIQKKLEAAQYIKLSKEKVHSRLESENRRLKKAIDMLLDYLMQIENGDSGNIKNSDEKNTEPLTGELTKGTDVDDSAI